MEQDIPNSNSDFLSEQEKVELSSTIESYLSTQRKIEKQSRLTRSLSPVTKDILALTGVAVGFSLVGNAVIIGMTALTGNSSPPEIFTFGIDLLKQTALVGVSVPTLAGFLHWSNSAK